MKIKDERETQTKNQKKKKTKKKIEQGERKL